MKYKQLIDSLMSELYKPKNLTEKEKALLLANALFSCTLSGFAIFLCKQQTLNLCTEDLNCSVAEAWVFFIPNGVSNSLMTLFTSAQLFSATQRALIGKNRSFYPEQKNSRKLTLRLTLSMLAGLLAAIPTMLSTQDPVGSKLVFVANFIIASYSFYTIALDLSASSSYKQPQVKLFLQNLKSYELRGAPIRQVNISLWIKISLAISLPILFNGPFCVNNILLLNKPDSKLGALHYILPEDKDSRLIASIILGTIFTLPWFILAGLFGYHSANTFLQQFYQNPFAKINPNFNQSLQMILGITSLCSFAVPVKFFINVKEELFSSCASICTIVTLFVAAAGALFYLMPNLKIGELIIVFWNLFLSNNRANHDDTFDIIHIRKLAAEFKDIQANFPAIEVDEISRELNNRLSTMTERTALLLYPQTDSQQQTYSLDNSQNAIELNPLIR